MLTKDDTKTKAGAAGRAMAEQSPEKRREIFQRQIEELEKLKDKPDEARSFLISEMGDVRQALTDLSSRADKEAADRQRMAELIDQQMELIRKLADDTIRRLHTSAPRKGSVTVRNFEDDDVARDYAICALAGTDHGRKLIERSEPHKKMWEDFQQRNLTGGSGSGNEFVVAPLQTQLIGSVKKYTALFEEVSTIPMSGPTYPLRRRGARTKGYRVDAGGSITASDMGNPTPDTLTAKKYAGLSILSSELWEDANVMPSLADLLIEDHGDTIAELAERDATIGVAGGADSGMSYNPGVFYATGIFNQSDYAAVTLQSGKTFASLTFDDLLALEGAIDERFAAGSKYHLHRSVLFALKGKKDDHGNFLWAPPSGGTPGTIWTYPYRTWRSAPATSQVVQAAKPFVAFGQINKAYLMGVRRGVTFDESREFKFDTDEIAFRSTMRMGFQKGDPEAMVRLQTQA